MALRRMSALRSGNFWQSPDCAAKFVFHIFMINALINPKPCRFDFFIRKLKRFSQYKKVDSPRSPPRVIIFLNQTCQNIFYTGLVYCDKSRARNSRYREGLPSLSGSLGPCLRRSLLYSLPILQHILQVQWLTTRCVALHGEAGCCGSDQADCRFKLSYY